MKVVYDKSRFPKQVAKGLCRGCHEPVPKGRFTWCSDTCLKRYHPRSVNRAVRQRDKGVCQICHFNISWLAQGYFKTHPKPQWDPSMGFGSPKAQAFRKASRKWEADCPKEEYDHIVPFSEGGATVLENMRTVCSVCHKERTAEWHARRKAAKR